MQCICIVEQQLNSACLAKIASPMETCVSTIGFGIEINAHCGRSVLHEKLDHICMTILTCPRESFLAIFIVSGIEINAARVAALFMRKSANSKWQAFSIVSDKIQAGKWSNFQKSGTRKMAATLVLKVESEGVFESDLRSVWIFELGQKLTEIATFF